MYFKLFFIQKNNCNTTAMKIKKKKKHMKVKGTIEKK